MRWFWIILICWGCGEMQPGGRQISPVGDVRCTDLESLQTWNLPRRELGLPPVTCHPQLVAMAEARSAYLTANGYSLDAPHTERAGAPGYTGETLQERGRTFGVTSSDFWLHEGLSRPEPMAEQFLNSVYHRHLVVAPGQQHIGLAVGPEAGVAILQEAAEPSVMQDVFFPADGTTNVPTMFASDEEWPDPVPEQNEVGYPLSVLLWRGFAQQNLPLEINQVTLHDGQRDVSLLVLRRQEDAQVRPGVLHLVPLHPLRSATRYTVHVDLRFGERAIKRTWSFITR